MLVFGLWCVLAGGLNAEAIYHLQMKVDPSGPITIGGELRLTVRIEHDLDYTLVPPSIPLALDPFEFRRMRPSPRRRSGSEVVESYTIVCTVFEVGDFKVPQIPFTLIGKGRSIELRTDEVPVRVESVLKPGDEVFRPIKGPVTLNVPWYEHYAFWLLILLILLCLLYLYLRRKRKLREEPATKEESVDPTTEAMKSLHELYQRHAVLFMDVESRLQKASGGGSMEKLSAAALKVMKEGATPHSRMSFQTSMRPFHLELSEIFRRYIRRRYGLQTFERTTTELVSVAKEQALNEDVVRWMETILRRSDYFKFSSRGASLVASQELWEWCWSFVVHTDANPSKEQEMEEGEGKP